MFHKIIKYRVQVKNFTNLKLKIDYVPENNKV